MKVSTRLLKAARVMPTL